MNATERRLLRRKMPWLKRSRPPAVLVAQIVAAFVLLFLMGLAFFNAKASVGTSPNAIVAQKSNAGIALVDLPPFVEKIAMQSLRTFLSSFRGVSTNDIGFADFNEPLPPLPVPAPEPRFAGSLDIALPFYSGYEPDILPVESSLAAPPRRFPDPPSGAVAFIDAALKRSGFKFEMPPREQFSVASGEVEFFVECAPKVETDVYLLSAANPDARVLEGALLKAVAEKPCRGRIRIVWHY